MDSWKTLIAVSLVALFCGCASQQQENAYNNACVYQRLIQEAQIRAERNIIASEVATMPEQYNPFRGSFGERRNANNPNDSIEVSLVSAYNKSLHDKEVDAWVKDLLAKSIAKQAQSSYGAYNAYNQPEASPSTFQQPYSSPNTVRPNAYGLGVNADQYGRPTTYQLQNGQQLDPIFNNGVKQNAYGLGVGMDQFGRPVYNSH